MTALLGALPGAAGSAVAIDWGLLLPVLAPGLGALVVLLLDALAPRADRVHSGLGLVALGTGLGAAVLAPARDATDRLTLCTPGPQGTCFYDATGLSPGLQAGALLAGLVVLLLLGSDAATERLAGGRSVAVALVLAGVTGAVTVAAATDIGTWLVALELATLPVVGLVALAGTRRAAHGALSLITTSVLSFGLLAVGAAMWLVATGTPTLAAAAAQAAWAAPQTRAVLVVAVLLMLAGLGFKVSAVPFHAWTPQAYAGSVVPVGLLLATVSKIAAVGGLLVVLRPVAGLTGDHPHQLALLLAGLAAATMTLGNVIALRQDDTVRLLAWSTVAQAGWVLLPLAALDARGLRAGAAYVLAYALATLVTFAAVAVAAGAADDRRLSAQAGLLRRQPLVGAALALGLLSLAGLPPGVVGLVAKVTALQPVMGAGLWPLALVAVANAVIGIAVYVRWLAVLFEDRGDRARPEPLSRPVAAALGLATLALVATSVAPQLVFGLL